MSKPRPDSGIQRAIAHAQRMRLAPGGFTNRELCMVTSCSEKVGKKAIAKLRQQGQLHTLPFGCAGGQQARYFGTQELLQAHASTLPPRPQSTASRQQARAANAANAGGRPPDLQHRLVQALQQAQWQGLTVPQALQAIGTRNANNISRLCKLLVAEGHAQEVRHSGRLLMFATGCWNRERIEAFEAETRRAILDAAKRGAQAHAKRRNYAAHQKPSVKRHYMARPAGEPAPVTLGENGLRGEVDASGARIVRVPAPRFDARYQVDPDTRVVGGFATAGIGRYLTPEQLEATPC